MAEGPLDGGDDAAEGGGVRGFGEGFEEDIAFFGAEVELPRAVSRDVDGDYAGDFFLEGADRDWHLSVSGFYRGT